MKMQVELTKTNNSRWVRKEAGEYACLVTVEDTNPTNYSDVLTLVIANNPFRGSHKLFNTANFSII